MSFLLPYRMIVFDTLLTCDEVLERLRLEVAKSGWYLFDQRREKFEGTMLQGSFEISRIIHYRNSFLPMIKGHIFPFGEGTRIEIKMSLHIAVIIFIVLWCGLVAMGAAAVSVGMLINGRIEAFMLIPFGMLLFVYLLMIFAFNFEADKAVKLLSEIFKAKENKQRR